MNVQQTNDNPYTFKTEDSYPEFNNLQIDRLFFNGQQTNSQIVSKSGKYVGTVGSRYVLFPNEIGLQIADKASSAIDDKELGKAIPFSQGHKDWFFIRPNDHVMYNNSLKTKMSALYLFDKEHDITGKGDTLKTGYGITNDEAGERSFGVFAFTFRKVCQNMMMHISNPKAISSQLENDNPMKVGIHQTVATSAIFRKHTKSLNPNDKEVLEMVENSIISVIEKTSDMIGDYKRLTEIELTQKKAEQIIKELPKKVTKNLDYISVNKDNEVKIIENVSEWDAFNGITSILTRGNIVSNKPITMDATVNYMKKTQNLFELR